jgi:hypothetical protein
VAEDAGIELRTVAIKAKLKQCFPKRPLPISSNLFSCIHIQAARLEVRRNFFSNRVIDSRIQLPTHVKNVKTVSSFKHGYKNYTAGLVPPHLKENENGDVTEMWRGQLCTDSS